MDNQFNLPEPTEEDIQATIEAVKKKYEVVLTKEDAIEYAKLYAELGQWFLMEKNISSSESMTDEMAEEIKDLLRKKRKQNIDLNDAQMIAKESLGIIIPREKERLGKELRAIINKYK